MSAIVAIEQTVAATDGGLVVNDQGKLRATDIVGPMNRSDQLLVAKAFMHRRVLVGVDTGGDGRGIRQGEVLAVGELVNRRTATGGSAPYLVLAAPGHEDRAGLIPLSSVTFIEESR